MSYKHLFAVLIVLAFVSSCSNGGDSRTSENYRTGSDGLVMGFLSRMPDKFYTGTSSSRFALEIRNAGAFPQRDEKGHFKGRICIGGFDKEIIKIAPEIGAGSRDVDCVTLNTDTLEGKSPINLDGGYTTQMFNVETGSLLPDVPSYQTSVIISISYRYKTSAFPIVCIDTKPYQYRESRICEVSSYSSISTGTQGAPIAVTQVEEEAFSDGLLFRIYVKNVGGGIVIPYSDDTIVGNRNPQNKNFNWNDLDYVALEYASLAGKPLDCNPLRIKLVNGEGVVFCKYIAREERNVFKSPLNIVLRYGYLSTISKDIEVIRQPELDRW